MVDIKSESDIEKMRVAGKLASDVLSMIGPFVKQEFLQKNWIKYVMILLSIIKMRSQPL